MEGGVVQWRQGAAEYDAWFHRKVETARAWADAAVWRAGIRRKLAGGPA